MNYETLTAHLMELLPFINEVTIIKGKKKVVYSSKNWHTRQEITNIIFSWQNQKAREISVSEIKYVMRLYTKDRLVMSSIKGNGHIIGIKDDVRAIIALIEPDGIIPYAFIEMSRVLASLKTRVPYMTDKDPLVQKAKEMGFSSIAADKLTTEQSADCSTDESTEIMFTARLMAYYRALELKQKFPILRDPFAKNLAGDLSSFLDKHLRYAEMDYPIVRSSYIEEQLLKPWCNSRSKSQIVILGAGLDTRAYRFEPLRMNQHRVFELDFPRIISYKQEILKPYSPLCEITRISTDITAPSWANQLIEKGFIPELPTFWIMEGFVYYMNQKQAEALLTKTKEMSMRDGQIFVDILHVSRWFSSLYTKIENSQDLFSKHLKWGLNMREIASFFDSLGWSISCSFADDYDQGRNVGQKAMVFVHGKLVKKGGQN